MNVVTTVSAILRVLQHGVCHCHELFDVHRLADIFRLRQVMEGAEELLTTRLKLGWLICSNVPVHQLKEKHFRRVLEERLVLGQLRNGVDVGDDALV